jgi:hypothetical protein
MSTYHTVLEVKYGLKRSNREAAFTRLKADTENNRYYCHNGDDANSLETLLVACNWEPAFDEAGNIIGLKYLGHNACRTDALHTIAEFAEPGSYVIYAGDNETPREIVKVWVDKPAGQRENIKQFDSILFQDPKKAITRAFGGICVYVPHERDEATLNELMKHKDYRVRLGSSEALAVLSLRRWTALHAENYGAYNCLLVGHFTQVWTEFLIDQLNSGDPSRRRQAIFDIRLAKWAVGGCGETLADLWRRRDELKMAPYEIEELQLALNRIMKESPNFRQDGKKIGPPAPGQKKIHGKPHKDPDLPS